MQTVQLIAPQPVYVEIATAYNEYLSNRDFVGDFADWLSSQGYKLVKA